MKFPTTLKTKRSGTSIVELAVVIVIFSMLMFGILEYCLIVYTTNVVENAAREGSRYAVVNSTDSTMITDTKSYVQSLMGGMDQTMSGYSCTIYQADATGTLVNSDPTVAQFGQYICVEVSLNYVPITPGLIYLKQFTIRSKCCMISEAN